MKNKLSTTRGSARRAIIELEVLQYEPMFLAQEVSNFPNIYNSSSNSPFDCDTHRVRVGAQKQKLNRLQKS